MASSYTWNSRELVKETYCPLCGHASYHKIFVRSDQLPLHECTDCRFVYLGLRPNEKALDRYYADQYFDNSATYRHYFDYAQAVTDLEYCPRIARMKPFIGNWQQKKVLEIGCAAGSTLELLKRQGASVRGVEISAQAVKIARTHYGLEVLHSPFYAGKFKGEQFDILLLFDVLEHLPNPGAVLDDIRTLLAPGGIVVLTVPNFNRFDQIGAKWRGVQSYWEHLHYFRAEVLSRSLTNRDFTITEMHSFTGAAQEDTPNPEARMRAARNRILGRNALLRSSIRCLRKAKFYLTGPPELPVNADFSGMDLFCVAQKGVGGESIL